MNNLELYSIAKLDTRKPFSPKRVQHILDGKEKTNFPLELLPFVQFMATPCCVIIPSCQLFHAECANLIFSKVIFLTLS